MRRPYGRPRAGAAVTAACPPSRPGPSEVAAAPPAESTARSMAPTRDGAPGPAGRARRSALAIDGNTVVRPCAVRSSAPGRDRRRSRGRRSPARAPRWRQGVCTAPRGSRRASPDLDALLHDRDARRRDARSRPPCPERRPDRRPAVTRCGLLLGQASGAVHPERLAATRTVPHRAERRSATCQPSHDSASAAPASHRCSSTVAATAHGPARQHGRPDPQLGATARVPCRLPRSARLRTCTAGRALSHRLASSHERRGLRTWKRATTPACCSTSGLNLGEHEPASAERHCRGSPSGSTAAAAWHVPGQRARVDDRRCRDRSRCSRSGWFRWRTIAPGTTPITASGA